MNPELLGIHHLTAVTAKARENHQFYTHILGMRLVKKTVNQDDVSAYHLFYADAQGSPGSDLTFFDWAQGHDVKSLTDTFSSVGGTLRAKWTHVQADLAIGARIVHPRFTSQEHGSWQDHGIHLQIVTAL